MPPIPGAYPSDEKFPLKGEFVDTVHVEEPHPTRTRLLRRIFLILFALFVYLSLIGPPDLLKHHECPHAAARRQREHEGITFARALADQTLMNARAEQVDTNTGSAGARLLAGLGNSKAIEKEFLKHVSAKGAREALMRYTSKVHYAGLPADKKSAVRLLEEWADLMHVKLPKKSSDLVFDAGSNESRERMTGPLRHGSRVLPPRLWVDTYSVWLNWPGSKGSSLKLGPAPSPEDPTPQPTFVASLKEDVFDKDPTSKNGIPTFHGYSKPGSAHGQLVYANKGNHEDFLWLKEQGVDLKDKVVIVRYGGSFRGLKVRAAAEAGAVACLIYSDPGDDGEVTEANGVKAWPEGPARAPSSVQRGSVQGLSFYPGDPGTPGTPSYRNATRLDPEKADSLPTIPSIPISWADAKPLLAALENQGLRAPGNWQGGVPGIESYWTGPSSVKNTAYVYNDAGELQTRDIWNTYLFIPGYTDEVTIIGNHRDAWTFGAADPSSGTAVVHEIVKGLGALTQRGWKPARSILVASWDAEEYGLVGSTEMGEDYPEWIQKQVVTYLNLDVAVAGSSYEGQASPSLADLVISTAAEVVAPNGDGKETVKVSKVPALGSGSDFSVFLQRLGVASTNVGFSSTKKDPVYHYHSNFDSFAWMERYGDPAFKRHEAVARILGLMLLRTASPVVLPINTTAYSLELSKYLDKVREVTVRSFNVPDFAPLESAITSLQKASAELDLRRERAMRKLRDLLSGHGRHGHKKHCPEAMLRDFQSWHEAKYLPSSTDRRRPSCPRHGPIGEFCRVAFELRRIETQLRTFEQGFIDEKGLAQREWYRHLGVAPGRYKGYGADTFPGLTEAFTLDGGEGAQHETDRLVKRIEELAQRVQEAGHGRVAHLGDKRRTRKRQERKRRRDIKKRRS